VLRPVIIEKLKPQTERPDAWVAAGVTPDGKAISMNSRTGEFKISDISRQFGGGQGGVVNQKAHLGAVNAIDAIDHAIALYDADKTANVVPQIAAAMEGLSHLPVVGGAFRGTAEAQRQRRMTPTQQEFQGYMDTFAHNAVGLLPGSRQSITLFNNLRNSYARLPGQSDEAGAAKIEQLKRLRARLAEFLEGKPVRLDDVLGQDFADLTATPTPTAPKPAPRSPAAPNPVKYFHVPPTPPR
jgi:hypothetical protein